MPRFKPYDYRQSLFVPLVLQDQLPAGTFEHALHHLIEERIEEEWFEALYENDETGRPAYSPKLLLKVILFGYSRGLLGSRRLEAACRENITFMALSCGIKPDHSTIAEFVTKLQGRIEVIFAEVLLVCHEEGLLGGTHFSLDGLKLSSNAAKEASGTFKDLRLKKEKLERKLAEKMAEHRRQDRLDRKREDRSRDKDQAARAGSIQRLRAQAERIGRFLKEEEPRQGARGEVQSNVTDHDSCKMQTSHGVIQGYNAQALVDEKRQVVVCGAAMGSGQDHGHVAPMLEGAQEILELAGLAEVLPLKGVQLSADANYHSEQNLIACEAAEVDAYIPDVHFRLRDPRFADQQRHKEQARTKKGAWGVEQFTYEPKSDCYLCPQGKTLPLHAREHRTSKGHRYRCYRAYPADACHDCPVRAQCIARDGRRKSLFLAFAGNTPLPTRSAQMRQKIDQPASREIYAKRVAIVEPVFANVRINKRLDRFNYRGKEKVNIQWLLYCLVHNVEKIARYGSKYAPPSGPRPRLKRLLWRLITSLRAFRMLPNNHVRLEATFLTFRRV
jgi:transposase